MTNASTIEQMNVSSGPRPQEHERPDWIPVPRKWTGQLDQLGRPPLDFSSGTMLLSKSRQIKESRGRRRNLG